MMNQSQFEHLLDAYGTRWTAWPEAEREAAKTLLNTSEDARSLWQQAEALDDVLDTVIRPDPSAILRERVLASAVSAIRRPRRHVQAWAWLSGAGVAATAFAGAAFGVIIAHQINASMHADTVLYQASLTATDDTDVLSFEMAALPPQGR